MTLSLNSEAFTFFQDINEDCVIDPSYKLIYMEMDGTYVQNIEILFTFTYSAEPESIYNANEYNGNGPVVTTNALNHFTHLLEACVIVGSLKRELISHLKFHSNEYACG